MRERHWWSIFMWCAVALLVALTLHMFVMHMHKLLGFVGVIINDPLAWENTLARSKDIGMMIVLFVLLTAAIIHGLYGLRGILLEWIKSPAAQKAITWLIVIFGVVAYAWGLYVMFGVAALGG